MASGTGMKRIRLGIFPTHINLPPHIEHKETFPYRRKSPICIIQIRIGRKTINREDSSQEERNKEERRKRGKKNRNVKEVS